MTPGVMLLDLVSGARTSVLLVAPFATRAAVTRVLGAVPDDVGEVVLVTRWRAEDVAAGATDLGVLDAVAARRGACLLLHPTLHAKFYRADARCLAGSANLTETALGWSSKPNLELLVELTDPSVVGDFVARLMSDAYPATSGIRDAVAADAASTPRAAPAPSRWLPTCPSPQELWRVYSGSAAPRVVASALSAGRHDIAALGIPPGLDRAIFSDLVGQRFLAAPAVARLVARLHDRTTDDEGVRALRDGVLREQLPHGDPQAAWEILRRWLTVYGGYWSRSVAEELVRGRRL